MMNTTLFSVLLSVIQSFTIKSGSKTFQKYIFLLFFMLSSVGVWGQVNITPERTDVSGFPNWTDTDVAGTTYLQLLKATSSTITPAMDFDAYSNETLDFNARTFGGSTAAEIILTVSISTDNGANWTILGTRTPVNSTLNSQTQFDLSAYSGTQVKVKFSVAGTNNGIGVGIDGINIKGIAGKTVTFDANGGTGTMADQTASTATALITNTFTRAGYTFTGWNTAADGSGTAYADRASYPFSADATLYAQWTSLYTIGWCNLQFPTTNEAIDQGSSIVYYGRVYVAGVTDSSGEGTAVDAWVGYSSNNSDPSGSGWTWVAATYNTDDGPNNDEYKGTLSGLTPGTYYVAYRYNVSGGSYVYGGKNNAIWASTSDNAQLTVNSVLVDWCNLQSPSSGNIVEGGAFNVYAQVYHDGLTTNAGQAPGITGWIGYSTTNSDPSSSGWTWLPTTFNGERGMNNNNDEYTANIGTGLSANTYYYASRFQRTGSTEYKYGDINGVWSNIANNGVLTVEAPKTVTTIPNQNTVYGSAVNLTFAASHPVTSWSISALPSGLSLNATTGVLTGNIAQNVGTVSYTVTADFGGGKTDSKSFDWIVNQKPLTITGISGVNKIYDGNTVGTLSGAPTLVGIVGSDNVTISGTPAITFADKNVGTTKPLTISGYSLAGTKAGNYSLTQPTGISANITAKAVTVSGATAQNKPYDGTNATTITGVTLGGLISGDNVTVSGGGTFASPNVGTGISVAANLALGGTDAINYSITQPTGLSANITAIAPTIATSTISISVGGSYTLPGANITSNSLGALTYSITGGGKATYDGLLFTLNGVSVGSETLTVTQAAAGNYTARSANVEVNVSVINFVHGDFRTKTAGKWSYSSSIPGTTQWEKYNSTIPGWEDFVGQPNTNPEYTAYITKNTEIPTEATVHGRAKIIVTKDEITNIPATLTFKPSSNWTFRNIIIEEGATIDQQTIGFNVLGGADFEIKDGGNFLFNFSSTAASTLTSSLWAGVEKFHPASNFIVKDHKSGSGIYFLPPAANITSNTYNGVAAYFGNLIFESVNDLFLTATNLSGTTPYLTHQNFEINPLSNYRLIHGNGTWVIGNDLIINGPITITTGATTNFLNVMGNVSKTGSGDFRLVNNASGNVTLNITKNLIVSGTGNVNLNLAGTSLVNLYGDLNVSTGAGLFSGVASTFNLTGTGDGVTAVTTQTIDVKNQATASNISFNVNAGAYAKLINDFTLGSTSSLNVKGTFDADDKILAGISGTNLTVDPTGLFRTANAYGFSGALNDTLTPSVVTPNIAVTLESGSTVEYYGANQEITHGAATTTPTGANYQNLRISGTGIKTAIGETIVNEKTFVDAAQLILPETADNVASNVLTSKNGIEVTTGATVLFKSGAQLMQNANIVNTGNITMERKANVPSDQYNYWSSPVKSQALYDLYPNIPWNRVMVYNTATDYFTILPKPSPSIFGKGYSIKGSTSVAPAVNASFVGIPNNESSNAADNKIALSIAGNRYNLIGNPFPSNLDITKVRGGNTSQFDNAENTIYFWDNESNTDLVQMGSNYNSVIQNNYAIMNASSGDGTPAPRVTPGEKKPIPYIKPGQGFIMKASSGATELVLANTMRTSLVVRPSSSDTGVYYKGVLDSNKFWLQLTTPESMRIVIALGYYENADNKFDPYDSPIFDEGVTENFYSLSTDAKKLTIQGRNSDFNTFDVIPLTAKIHINGNAKISLYKKEGVFENDQAIYLHDKLNGSYTNLNEDAYQFAAVAGNTENRFEIVYRPSGTLVTTNATKGQLQVYRSGEYFVVKSTDSKIDEVEVYDAAGRLYQKVKGGTSEVRINATALANGMYVLKIKRNTEISSKKIIK